MPKRNEFSKLFFLSIAALIMTCVAVLSRRPPAALEPELTRRPLLEPVEDPPPPRPRPRPAGARFAAVASFTLLFFAGASFTAGAGDEFANMLAEDVAAAPETAETGADAELAAEPAPAPELAWFA